MKKVVLIISHLPDPRIIKRLSCLKKDFDVSIIYWNRKGKKCSWSEEGVTSYEIDILADRTNAIKRIMPTMRFIAKAFKLLSQIQPDIVYAFNMDMLTAAHLYAGPRGKKIVYEIADLHRLVMEEHLSFLENLFGKVVRKTEKRLCRKIDLLVVTSRKFYDVYYNKFVEKNKLVYLPNMPDIEPFRSYKKKEKGRFTVGFIGLVRYREQIEMLIRAAKEADIQVIIAGELLDEGLEGTIEKSENISYLGKYNYRQDIAKLYGLIDCVYAVYDADLYNVRVALPNRLYEAVYCELPVIVAKETYLSELVQENGIGIAVGHRSDKDLRQAIEELRDRGDRYRQMCDHCRKLKGKIDNGKHSDELLNRVKRI